MKIYQFVVTLCYFYNSSRTMKRSIYYYLTTLLLQMIYNCNKNLLKQIFSKSLSYILISLSATRKENYCTWYMDFFNIKIYILIYDPKSPTVFAYSKILIYIHLKTLKTRALWLLCSFIVNFLCNERDLLKKKSSEKTHYYSNCFCQNDFHLQICSSLRHLEIRHFGIVYGFRGNYNYNS